MTADEARTAIADFLAWHLSTVRSDALILVAYDLALSIGCSFYDGLYLALAQLAGCHLIFADRRLRNALDGQFARAVWIADYPPAAQ